MNNIVKNSWHLAGQEIDVWIIKSDNVSDVSLSFSELAYLKTIKLPSVARRFESARKLLRYLLSCYLGCSAVELNIEKTAQGKPFVSACPELFFNITHAKEIIAIAVSRYPVGIDLELIRELDFFSIASRFFSSKELSFLKRGNDREDRKTFFQLWTAKEAALKAGGAGIAHGLKNSFSMMEKGQVISVNVNQQSWQVNPFEISEHAPAADFLGAIATPLSQAVIHWHDLRPSVNNKA